MAVKTRLILDGVDKTKQAFQSASRNVTALEKSVATAQRAFGLLLGAGAIGGAVSSVAKASLAMDRFERSLRVATGSAKGATKELDFVIATSKELGLNLEQTAGAYSKLAAASKGTALQGKETREIFLAISEASTVLGLTADQTGGALTAIEQIISKGKVSAEELRGQLGERLPGAFQIAARSINKTTAELDDMLKKGELTAEDLLPELARELRETFGPEVVTAADSAQAAFERLNTSLFELKVSIADSGLIDAIASLSDKLSATIAPTLEQEIEAVRNKIEQMKQSFREAGGVGDLGDALTGLRQELFDLLKIQSQALNQIDRLNPTKAILSIAATDKALTDFFDKQDRNLERLRLKFVGEFETAEQEVARRLEEFSIVEHLFPEDEQQRIRAAISETLLEGIEEVEEAISEDLPSKAEEGFSQVTEFGRQAARNIQDELANFLFDPFDEGLEGMLKGFLDITRRMLAEITSHQILSSIFGEGFEKKGLGDIFGGIFSGGDGVPGTTPPTVPAFANGGSFTVGGSGGVDSQFVPFLATPGERVTVTKPGQSGGGTVNHFSIDARGRDSDDFIGLVPLIIDQAVKQAEQKRRDAKFKGRD